MTNSSASSISIPGENTSGSKEARSITSETKTLIHNKFVDKPSYTFGLEDAVSRDYPSLLKKFTEKSFNRRYSRGDSEAQDSSFSAIVGYPYNSWQRINRKKIL